MTTTPVSKSKLSCKNPKINIDGKKEAEPTTPLSRNTCMEQEDYSPVFFQLTQEANEEIDVMWDWHSPQSSQRRRRKQKRIIHTQQSPKVPFRRFPSNNQNQEFEKLKNELLLLQQELAVPDDERCLCVSPQQETEIKLGDSTLENQLSNEDFDIFNDSMDEDLVLFSQKIENELIHEAKKEETNTDFSTFCDTTQINQIIDKYKEEKVDTLFDLTPTKISVNKISNNSLKRTLPEENRPTQHFLPNSLGKEFHRTKSFELTLAHYNLTKTDIDEIERKRLEAKAKLESKMKNTLMNNLPEKCSDSEIEKKRQQALAKLESKQLQEIVEKKRQEALKKLQKNRMKNASQVKGTLTKRL